MHEPNIHFLFNNTSFKLLKIRKLKTFIAWIFKKEERKLITLNCVFCTDKYLLDINKLYLSHNFYTDILTFDLSESEYVVSEIYISLDRIRENAKSFNESMNRELLRVLFHGILHLCGYNDTTKKQKRIMTTKEEYYLAQWNRF